MRALIIFILFSVIGGNLLFGQSANQPNSFRIYLDNDFLNFRGDGTDRYYTNGIRLDYFYYKQRKAKFLSSILLHIDEQQNVYGWGLAQFMFTPRHIDIPEIQYDDRPYAGALYAIHSLQSINASTKTKISTELFLGVIGNLSFTKESQTWVHGLINYTKPLGWDNQIPNDIIINYNIIIEKRLLQPSKSILLIGLVETFSGTLYNAAGVGFMLRIGKFDDYFNVKDKSKHSNKYQLYVFMRPVGRVVLSNALLEGGLINKLTGKNDHYTLDKDQIERFNILYDVGLCFEKSRFSISISQKLRTAEFKGQYVQEVGNITVRIRLSG
jgi:hypothetical protein